MTLLRNYALQREEMGMLVTCEPFVWFCMNKKKNLYQKFSNKTQHGANGMSASMITNRDRKHVIVCL